MDMPVPDSGNWPNMAHKHIEVDNRIYGNLDTDLDTIELAVGRIFGITTSDASAYVSRVLFYDDLAGYNDKKAFINPLEIHQIENEDTCEWTQPFINRTYSLSCGNYQRDGPECKKPYQDIFANDYWSNSLSGEFSNIVSSVGWDETMKYKSYIQSSVISDANLIVYIDHGGPEGIYLNDYSYSGIANKVLKPVIFLGTACSTCAFDEIDNKGKLFCSQMIRRGAIADQGSVTPSYWNRELDTLLNDIYISKLPLGLAYKDAKNQEVIKLKKCMPWFDPYYGDPFYVLIADPTFSLNGGIK